MRLVEQIHYNIYDESMIIHQNLMSIFLLGKCVHKLYILCKYIMIHY